MRRCPSFRRIRPDPLSGPASTTVEECPSFAFALTVTFVCNVSTPENVPIALTVLLPSLSVDVFSTTTAVGIVFVSHKFSVPPLRTNWPLLPDAPPPFPPRTVYIAPESMYTFSVPLKFNVEMHSWSLMFEALRLWFSRLTVPMSMRWGPHIRQSALSIFTVPIDLLVSPGPVLASAPMPL